MNAPENKTTSAKPSGRATADWERIELDYRAGIKTLRQIADEHRITHGAVNKRANRDGWTRDLQAKIHAKAEEKVSRATVAVSMDPAARRLTELEVVEGNSNAIVGVRLSQRKDIGRGRNLVMSLFAELELACGPTNAELIAELGEIMRSPDERGQDRRNDVYEKLMSLPGRVKAAKELGEALKTLVGMEREAFGIKSDETDSPVGAVASLLSRLGRSSLPVTPESQAD